MDFSESQQEISKNDRLWATFCHLSAFAFFIIFGLGHIIVPLIFWLVKRQDSDFVDRHGREAINFQISNTIYAIICLLLRLIGIGLLLLAALFISWFILVILASIKANNGEEYQYPMTIRFI